jgi:hypothetical protein
MYETLLEDIHTKIYLDLDFKDISLSTYNDKKNIFVNFNKYFVDFLDNKKIKYENIIYMDASRIIGIDMYKLSLHVIVNGVAFKNRNLLKKLIIEFKNTLLNDTLYYKAIDTGIYGSPQLFKCVLSPSKNDDTLLRPFDIKNDNLIYTDNTEIIDNILHYLVGIYVDDIIYIDENFNYLLKENNENKKIHNKHNNITKEMIPAKTVAWIERNYYVNNIYKLRNIYMYDNKIDLLRLKPAFCKLCSRVHENENAFCKIEKNNIIFYCGRNANGKVIGSWYTNGNKKKTYNDNNKVLNDNNKVLNDTIKELRKYIEELEEKHNEAIRKINNLSKIVCNNIVKKNNGIIEKKYTKDISSGMWTKYYNLGKAIKEDIKELYDNIIGHWKDGCVSRLKNRAVRIYEYINKYKGNPKGYSLRYLFHMKNKDFQLLL